MTEANLPDQKIPNDCGFLTFAGGDDADADRGKGTNKVPDKNANSGNVSSVGDASFAGGDDADLDHGKGTNKVPDKNANSGNVSYVGDVGPSSVGGEIAVADSDCVSVRMNSPTRIPSS